MYKRFFVFFILLFLFPSLSHGEIVSESIFLVELHKTHISSWGDILLAYYNKDYWLNLKNITQGWSVHINTTDPPDSQPSGIAIDTEGDSIYMAWRSKERKKEIYFRVSHDRGKKWTDIKRLNTEDQALLSLCLKAQGDKVVAVWRDERDGDNFHLYMNFSEDRGKTFLESDIKVSEGYESGSNPSVLLKDGRILVFFSGKKNGVNYIVLKSTTDGKTWKDELISETGGAYDIHPIMIGGRILVFWCVGWDGIRGAYSDSDGATWEKVSFDDTRTLDVGSIRVAHTQKGDVYVSLYARKEQDKTRVYLYQSHDCGVTWSGMKRIDETPDDLTRAALQEIKADDKGRVVIVWQDYRNIRSNIYMKYSMDHGKTWSKDIPLEEKGKYNSAYPSVEMKDGGLSIIVWRYRDDGLSEAYLYLFPFKEVRS